MTSTQTTDRETKPSGLLRNAGKALRRIWAALSSVSRSWLICVFNYPALSYAVILSSLGVLTVVAYLAHSSDTWKLILPLAACGCAFLVGTLYSATFLQTFFTRAKLLLEHPPEGHEPIRDPKHGTGIFPLDEILNAHLTSVQGLRDTVETMSEETSVLVERYETLTDNLAAAVIIRDTEGRLAYCSPFTEVLTGYPLSEMYDDPEDFFLRILHPDDVAAYTRALRVSAMGDAFQFRYRLFHKSGIEIWAETRTVPILSEDGEVVSSLSITLDVTGAVRYQKQVEEKNRDLQDFTYMVSHDLKAPIFTIQGMTKVIEEDFSLQIPDDLKEPLTHIRSASERLESLVQSVLEYSKITSTDLVRGPINLSAVLKDIQSDYGSQIEKLSGTFTIDNDLPTVMGDRVPLYQIFGNLVGNSLKYRDPDRAPHIQINAEILGPNTASISVKDNGLGIPEDKLDLVFRPFQRAHRGETQGSGIGLACVQKLAQKLGGSVSLESVEGVGSTFSVMLHLARKSAR